MKISSRFQNVGIARAQGGRSDAFPPLCAKSTFVQNGKTFKLVLKHLLDNLD